MATNPEFEYVNLMHNGVLKRISVPSATNTSQSGLGLDLPQPSPSVFGRSFVPYASNSTESTASPSVVQARNQLSGALAKNTSSGTLDKNRVFLTSSHGIGSLSSSIRSSQLGNQPTVAGQVKSASTVGQIPMLIQPTLVQGAQRQQIVLANPQQAHLVMTAEGTPAYLLPATFQPQPTSNLVQLPNGMVVRTSQAVGNFAQLVSATGQNTNLGIVQKVQTNTLTRSVPATKTEAINNTLTTPAPGNIPKEDTASSDIRIGSVFSLKNMKCSKIIKIEPEDSDVNVDVEDDDEPSEENEQISAGYQVLAEWAQEDDSNSSEVTEKLPKEAPQLIPIENTQESTIGPSPTQMQMTPNQTTTRVSTDHVVSTLKSALKSPKSNSFAAQLPDGRIVLVSPSGDNAGGAQDVLKSVLQNEKLQTNDTPKTSSTISPVKTINIVRVHRVQKTSTEQPMCSETFSTETVQNNPKLPLERESKNNELAGSDVYTTTRPIHDTCVQPAKITHSEDNSCTSDEGVMHNTASYEESDNDDKTDSTYVPEGAPDALDSSSRARKDFYKETNEMEHTEHIPKERNVGRRTRRPKRNLAKAYVKLTSMRLGKKTTINLKKCLIPAVRYTFQTKPKPTSTNVFRIQNHIPSALDLKAEAEAEIEAQERAHGTTKDIDSIEDTTTIIDKIPKKKTHSSDSDTINSGTSSKIIDTKEVKGNQSNSPSESHLATDQSVDNVDENVSEEKSKFFLIKTSSGNYLVPMREGENGAIDSAMKAQASIKEYLSGSQSTSKSENFVSVSKPIRLVQSSEKSMASDQSNVEQNRQVISVGSNHREALMGEELSEKRASKRTSTEPPSSDLVPAKVAKISNVNKPAERPRAHSDKIKALKEKLKRDQEKLEAIRKKNLARSPLAEFDDL